MWQRLMTWIGVLVLFYAGYSHRDYKKYMARLGENASSDELITKEVVLQVIVGFTLILLGQLSLLKLKPIRMGSDIKGVSYEETMADSDYITFNNRSSQFTRRKAAVAMNTTKL